MQRLVLASNNLGKLREFNQLLHDLPLEIVAQGTLGIPETEEPHPTFVENALTKARHASLHSGLPALADDSGLCVPALNNQPGVLSARYAGEPKSDIRNNAHLLAQLAAQGNRSAYYYCVLVYVRHAADPQPIISEGIWRGEILSAPRGSGGFGYDPLFYLPTLRRTAAELDPSEKNRLSHRGQALHTLLQRLVGLYPQTLPSAQRIR